MTTQRLSLSIATVLLCFAVTSLMAEASAKAQKIEITVENYRILLVPSAARQKDRINLNGRQCSRGNHPGCMLFQERTVGLIEFSLPGASGQRFKCSDGVPSVITGIELSTEPLAGNDHKGDFDASVDPWISDYAFSAVELSTGHVYSANLDTSRTKVYLVNKNSHLDGATKSFWWRVFVTNCKDPNQVWVIDPRGDNEGIN